ncbi:chlorophyll a/b-binding protein-domain-containing protein [Ostreococcus tauri]|uniref:Chlorophyll a-b binding protein, chloroplastic n=1 Tax=Ostreococcus tauri TaxID=70448 RepID=A0A1Y5IEW2_OSTTA|nr:chlorophyll a/b-binding protein-domain-containing protein [Ostreococcus tauri]
MRTSIAGSYDRVGVRRWTRDARGFETWKRRETDERISIDSFPTNSDPFGLGKPAEYLQFDLDALDGSAARNPSGNVIGKLKKADSKPKARAIVPYDEAFDIMRFRECELLHSRWAMLGLVGAAAAEAATGITWADAGKIELEQPQYLGFPIQLTVTQLTIIEVLAMGYLEIARSAELDQNKRMYPGGAFDPLGYVAKADAQEEFRLKTAELKHGRLAMAGMLIISIEAATGRGTLPGSW